MEPIAIVKKRSRIWLVMVLLVIIMLIVAAALWFMGDTSATDTISRLSQGPAWSGLVSGEGRA